MAQVQTITDRIVAAVSQTPGCLIEDLVRACPDFTWNQIFLEVDRLSRTGQVRLTLKGAGLYSLMLPTRGHGNSSTVSPGEADMKTAPVMAAQESSYYCDRCYGLMVPERFANLDLAWWRCVNCGEVLDSVIIAHRRENAGQERRRRFQRRSVLEQHG